MNRHGILLLLTSMILCLHPIETPAQAYSVVRSFGVLTNVTGFSPITPLVQGPDGTLYGTADAGESAQGTVFKIQPDGTGLTTLKVFINAADGANPNGGLFLSGSNLFGTTLSGGSTGNGTIFKVRTDGSNFAVLKNFGTTGTDGTGPQSILVMSGSQLFGTTTLGGTSGSGTVFAINTDGTGYKVIKSFGTFANDGKSPNASLAVSGTALYGTTYAGGLNDTGAIFKLNTDGTGYSVLKSFGLDFTEGLYPGAGLVASGTVLYGTAIGGGASGTGAIFKINTDGTGFAVLKSFSTPSGNNINTDGIKPLSVLTLNGSTLFGTTETGGPSGGGTVFSMNTDGTGFTVIKSFDNTTIEGGFIYAGVVVSGNTLFGTTSSGGSAGEGTLFKVQTDGTGYSRLINFGFSDAVNPYGALLLSGATLYGTTSGGGTNANGTVFKVKPDGSGYSVIKSFTGADGSGSQAGLVSAGNTLFGTTLNGGSYGNGTVFAVSSDGTAFQVLRSFAKSSTEGGNPYAALILSGATLYGTTFSGGASANGTVFKINTNGTGFAVLKHFSALDASNINADGANPASTLSLGGSTLFGTAQEGGAFGGGTVFKLNTDGTGFTVLANLGAAGTDASTPNAGMLLSGATLYGTAGGGNFGNGTVFKVNTDGTGYAVLKIFSAMNTNNVNTDGANPNSVLAINGNSLYGTASTGGTSGNGTVFKINTDGSGFAVLYNFSTPVNGVNGDGSSPMGGVIFSGNTLYGTATFGGNLNDGTIFSLALSIPINIRLSGGAVVLTWTNSVFTLQSSPSATGAFTNVPGALSPFNTPANGAQQFFRLSGN